MDRIQFLIHPMTTEPNSLSATITQPVVAPSDRLRELLHGPKQADASWQDETGRMVSLLAVRFGQDADEVAALSTLALVGLATAAGVKEAKKKAIRLTRWSTIAPPQLAALADPAEQHAAVVALSKVKAPWATPYIDEALGAKNVRGDVLADLLRWARSVAASWSGFVEGPYVKAVTESEDGTRALALLKDAPRLLKLTEVMPGEQVATGLDALTQAIIGSVSRFSGDAKISGAIANAGFAVLEDAWRALPSLLLQPAFLSATASLCEAVRALKKSPPGSLGASSLATMALVVDLVRRYGAAATEQCRPLVPMWTAAYPDFQQQLKRALASEPALLALMTGAPAGGVSAEQDYAAEAVFASLLPAWDAFAADLPDPTRVTSMTAMLHRAAATANVEPSDVVGETVGYDPLSHHLAEASDKSPARVRILRAGVLARRADGSVRTLVRALVASI